MKKLILLFAFICSVTFTYSQVCSSCNASGWDTSVPEGTNQVYSVPTLSGATYVWVVTGGLNIVSGQGSSSVTIQVNGNGTLYVTRYKTGHSACANKATIVSESEPDCEMLINHEPCYTTHITGCPVSNATSYRWYVNGTYHGMGNINSNGTHWIELGFLNSGSPNYYHLRNTNITVCAKAYSASGVYLGQECKTYYAFCFGNARVEVDEEREEPEVHGTLNVYPNPASKTGEVFFTGLPLETIKSIRLLNIEGKVLQSFSKVTENSIRIDQSKQLRGLYILQIETQEGTLNRKLLLE